MFLGNARAHLTASTAGSWAWGCHQVVSLSGWILFSHMSALSSGKLYLCGSQTAMTKSSLSKSFPQKFQNLLLFVLYCVSYPVLDQILWLWLSRPGSLTHLWVSGQGNRNSKGGFGWSIDKEQWLHCRGNTPLSRLGAAAVRGYTKSKVRSGSCALLEQLWRDTLRPR